MKLKRIMALVLAFCMVFTSMSLSAFAEGEGNVVEVDSETAFQAALAAEGTETISFSADITIDSKISVPDGVTIDLNDKTLYVNVENSTFGNVTVTNGNIVLGKDDVHVCDGYFLVNEGKTLVLNNVNMSSADGGIKGYCVFHLKTGANLDLIDSELDIRDNEYSEGYIVYAGESTATVDVTDTTVYGNNVNGIVHATTVIDNSSFTVEDAVEHGINRSAVTINDSTVTISGGTGRGITAQHGDLIISGNSVVKISEMGGATIELRNDKNLSVADTATVKVDVAVNNTTAGTVTGNVTVGDVNAVTVATVNGVGYTDLQEAIKAAAPAGTVEIIADVTVDEWVMIAESLTIGNDDLITLTIDGMTINGNGHTLTINSIESAGNGGYLFFDAANLNVNNLTIKYAEGLAGAIALKSGTLDKVTFDGCVYGVIPKSGEVVIQNCTFKTAGTSIYFEEERDGLTVTGCTFENADTVNVILLRGDVNFTNNNVLSGRTVNVVSGSPVVTGNNFNDVRLKVYNDATATIEDNVINVLAFNDDSEVLSTFGENTLSADAEQALEDAGVIYVIDDIDELKAFRDAVNAGTTYKGKYVMLADDIDLTGENWTPIGNDTNYFWGTFDGRNHTISNMTIDINTPDSNVFAGLFGGVRKATIKNLTIKDASIDVVGAKVRAAAVAAIAHSNSENHTTANLNFENITVDGCTINAEAKSDSAAVGGLSGYCYPANMTNISVSNLTLNPKASSTVFTGGLVGYMQGQNISNNGNTRAYYTVDTFNLKNITINSETTDSLIGGFAGYTYYGYITLKNATIDGFKVDVDVTKEALVGGLIGLAHRSDKGHTFTDVEVTGIDFDIVSDSGVDVLVGGMVGYSGSPIAYSDCSASGTITETCSDSSVTSSAIVGGFVGATTSWTQSYTNCSANVDVSATNIAGGFVGHNGVAATYTDCEASGDVAGTAVTAGGFAGNADSATIINCNYTGESNVPFIGGTSTGATIYVAQVGDEYYKTIAEAISSANGATITIIADTTEDITIADGATVVIDLDGHTLYGYIAPSTPTSLTVRNGNIVNKNYKYSAIEVNSGKLTVENVNIESERHAVRIDGPVDATINGGVYRVLVNNDVTAHAVNVSKTATVTIKDGTFYGPKGTPNGSAMGGSAVNAQTGSTVIIEGGNFSGGVNNTLSAAGTLTVKGGVFDQDPTSYVADGYVATPNADKTLYTVYAKWTTGGGSTPPGDGGAAPVTPPADDELENYKPDIMTDEHYAYIMGREDGKIYPQANLTRAEAATIFFRLLKEDVRAQCMTKDNKFTDVESGAWYNTAVSTLANLGLINGRTETTYAPNAPITRAELTTIVARLSKAQYSGANLFTDISGHWAKDYINIAASIKWVNGENGKFRPDDNITRAEVMTLINRVLNRQPETKADLLDGMKVWPDNSEPNVWYYMAVQEATNSHEYTMKADGIHETWTRLTEDPNWAAMEK